MQAVPRSSKSKVALSSGGARRTNLAGVLQNIDSQIQIQLASTHVEATRTLLAHIRQRFNGEIWLIEGGRTEPRLQGFINFGYDKLIEEFDVTLQEIGEGETTLLDVFDRQLRPMQVKVDERVLSSEFIISIGPPKVHNAVVFTGSLKNVIMGALIIDKVPPSTVIYGRLHKKILRKLYGWYSKLIKKLPLIINR